MSTQRLFFKFEMRLKHRASHRLAFGSRSVVCCLHACSDVEYLCIGMVDKNKSDTVSQKTMSFLLEVHPILIKTQKYQGLIYSYTRLEPRSMPLCHTVGCRWRES